MIHLAHQRWTLKVIGDGEEDVVHHRRSCASLTLWLIHMQFDAHTHAWWFTSCKHVSNGMSSGSMLTRGESRLCSAGFFFVLFLRFFMASSALLPFFSSSLFVVITIAAAVVVVVAVIVVAASTVVLLRRIPQFSHPLSRDGYTLRITSSSVSVMMTSLRIMFYNPTTTPICVFASVSLDVILLIFKDVSHSVHDRRRRKMWRTRLVSQSLYLQTT